MKNLLSLLSLQMTGRTFQMKVGSATPITIPPPPVMMVRGAFSSSFSSAFNISRGS